MLIEWDFESPLFIDETIESLTNKYVDGDFIGVDSDKWKAIAEIWLVNNPISINISLERVINEHKKAAIKLIKDSQIVWERRYNVSDIILN